MKNKNNETTPSDIFEGTDEDLVDFSSGSPFDNVNDDDENGEFQFNQEEEEEETDPNEGLIEDEEEEEEEQEGNNEEDEDEDETPAEEVNLNPIAILARSYKESGILPADIEIPDEITDVEFSDLYEKVKEETSENEIIKKYREREGLTDEAIKIAKQWEFGVEPEEIQREKFYKTLASYPLNEESETFETDVQQYLTLYYQDLKMDPKLVEKNVARDLEDDDLMETLATAKNHFVSQKNTVETQNIKRAEDEANARAAKLESESKKLVELLDKGELKGSKYSKEQMSAVKKALFERSEIVEIDGKKYRVTAYDKKIREMDAEAQLKYKADFILGITSKTTEDELIEKGKKSALSDLNKAASIKGMSGKGSPSGSGQREVKNISKFPFGEPFLEM